ncbi:MAG: hypothetical protein KAS67_01610 [Thermoplasmata archaeon]|nr:hypothetical protein [Thermoplasmata archaeon]
MSIDSHSSSHDHNHSHSHAPLEFECEACDECQNGCVIDNKVKVIEH